MRTSPGLPSREEKKYITAHTYAYGLLKENAKDMRSNPTDAESVAWQYLRNKQLGVKFRRQHIIGDYIVDFVCLEKQLIVEIDGKYHTCKEQQELDSIRENILQKEGYQIIRFSNEEVIMNTDQVIEKIKSYLYELQQ